MVLFYIYIYKVRHDFVLLIRMINFFNYKYDRNVNFGFGFLRKLPNRANTFYYSLFAKAENEKTIS